MSLPKNTAKLRFALITEEALDKLRPRPRPRPRSQSQSPSHEHIRAPDMASIYEMISANVSQLVDQRIKDMNFEKVIENKISALLDNRRSKLEQELSEVRAKRAEELRERSQADSFKPLYPLHFRGTRIKSSSTERQQPQQQPNQYQSRAFGEPIEKQSRASGMEKCSYPVQHAVHHHRSQCNAHKLRSKENSMESMAARYMAEMDATRNKNVRFRPKASKYNK